jgi:hypothetical protein
MKIKMKMGYRSSDDEVGVDATGDVRVLPQAANMMPWQFRHTYPGGSLVRFTNGFPPTLVHVKAGLSGTIQMRLWVEYYLLKRNK